MNPSNRHNPLRKVFNLQTYFSDPDIAERYGNCLARFYALGFDPELVPLFFKNWKCTRVHPTIPLNEHAAAFRLIFEHSEFAWRVEIQIWRAPMVVQHKPGKILGEYTLDGKNYLLLPATFGEFISDVLRHDDFILEFNAIGMNAAFGQMPSRVAIYAKQRLREYVPAGPLHGLTKSKV